MSKTFVLVDACSYFNCDRAGNEKLESHILIESVYLISDLHNKKYIYRDIIADMALTITSSGFFLSINPDPIPCL